MPTIDQLAPATAASDGDELLASQSGSARKVTRAQLVAGLQPQIVVPQGALLGRASAGSGAPESIQVGTNLSLNAGTLSAAASPFVISSLKSGVIPGAADVVPVSQNGTNVAVPYSQFMNGLPAVPGVDVSAAMLKPTGATSAQKLSDWAAGVLLKAGGTLSGALTLASDPSNGQQATTKQYVDNQVATALPRSGGTLTGALTLQANPTTPLQAASKQYVDGQISTVLPLSGGALTGSLTAPSISATGTAVIGGTLSAGSISGSQKGSSTITLGPLLSLSRAGSNPTDGPSISSGISVNHAGGTGVYSNASFGSIVNNATNAAGGFVDGPSTSIWGISSNLTVNSVLGSAGQPQGPHAAVVATASKKTPPGGYPAGRQSPQMCGIYAPVADLTGQPSSLSSITYGGLIALSSNNLDPANGRVGQKIQLNDAVSLSNGGMPTEWASALSTATGPDSFFKWHIAPSGNYSISVLDTRGTNGASSTVKVSLSAPSTTVSVDPVLPFCSAGLSGQPVAPGNPSQVQVGSNTYTLIGASLDGPGLTSGKLTFLTPVSVGDGAAGNLVLGPSRTIWLASGQQVALDTAGAATFSYDAKLSAIRSSAAMLVGGAVGVAGTLSVAAGATLSTSLSVGASISCGGSFAAGGSITTSGLSATGSISVGTSLTVAGSAALGSTTVSGGLTASGSIAALGTLSSAALTSSGNLTVGGSASVVGRIAVQGGISVTGGTAVLPSYAVASLPIASPGALAYASNGRKPGEAAGAGSGVLVWGTAAKQWLSILSGTTVQA